MSEHASVSDKTIPSPSPIVPSHLPTSKDTQQEGGAQATATNPVVVVSVATDSAANMPEHAPIPLTSAIPIPPLIAASHLLTPNRTQERNTANPGLLGASAVAIPASKLKLKRFRFSDVADLLLLKSVSAAGAHLAAWGQKGVLFEDAHKRFLAAAPDSIISGREKPSQKTVEDRFKALILKRRDMNKETAAASGIVEVTGERETLLDDIILEMDEKAEEERVEREERTEKEKKLVTAGDKIRNAALRRNTGNRNQKGSQGDQSRGTSSRNSPSGSGRASRAAHAMYVCDSDEEDSKMLKEEFMQRQQTEKRRLEIDEKRLTLEEKRLRLDEMRFHESQETANRRLDLDEKRTAAEMEERKQALTERSKMIDVLSALSDKLH